MHTITSRLKVLIARTFRAEKLYSSMRTNDQGGEAASASLLVELANEVRAREWQRAHTKLRKVLNEIIERSAPAELGSEIVRLHKHFSVKAGESESLLSAGLAELPDMSRRQEFSALLKLSAELVRYKARYQAYQALADELASVLDNSGRSVDWDEDEQIGEALEDELFAADGEDIAVKKLAANGSTESVEPILTKVRNVIPLRRR